MIASTFTGKQTNKQIRGNQTDKISFDVSEGQSFVSRFPSVLIQRFCFVSHCFKSFHVQCVQHVQVVWRDSYRKNQTQCGLKKERLLTNLYHWIFASTAKKNGLFYHSFE